MIQNNAVKLSHVNLLRVWPETRLLHVETDLLRNLLEHLLG